MSPSVAGRCRYTSVRGKYCLAEHRSLALTNLAVDILELRVLSSLETLLQVLLHPVQMVVYMFQEGHAVWQWDQKKQPILPVLGGRPVVR